MEKTKKIMRILFAVYAILMIWLLFGQRMSATISGTWTENYWDDFTQKINLIPLKTITEFWNNLHSGGRSHAFINLAGNVIMFVPLGFFIPFAFRKAGTFFRSMLYSFAIIISIELIQLFTLLGSLDIDDLILNMTGVVLGYAAYKITVFFIERK